MAKNVTITADEDVLRRAREVARRQGSTLNAMIRGYLELVASRAGDGSAAQELMELFRSSGGRSGGHGTRRDEAYADRT